MTVIFDTLFDTSYLGVANLLNMAKNKTTIRFVLRNDIMNKDGKAPIHLCYQIHGQKKFYSTGINILPVNWDSTIQQIVYADKKTVKRKDPSTKSELLLDTKEIKEGNHELSGLKITINKIEEKFKDEQKVFSPQMVIDALKISQKPETKRDEPGVNIVDFVDRFIAETTDHKRGTLKEYQSLANHMSDYEQLKKVKFTFEGDASILNSFSQYLTEIKDVNNITKAKLITTFKTILRHAKKIPYKIKSNPDYFDYKVQRDDNKLEVIALTEEELNTIFSLDLSNNRALDESRDIFCFSCATGLRYGDLDNLRWQHIRKDNTIQMSMSDKNGKMIDIPLNPISYAIIQKYSGKLNPLPSSSIKQKLISNQKLNVNIKKIGKLAGIDTDIEVVREYGKERRVLGVFKKHELLSIHVGRKTFTTLSLAKGIPIQDVMALTTHSSFKAVKRYIDVTKDRKRTVMANAWGEIPKSNLKAV